MNTNEERRICEICNENLYFNEVTGGLGYWGHSENREMGGPRDHVAKPKRLNTYAQINLTVITDWCYSRRKIPDCSFATTDT